MTAKEQSADRTPRKQKKRSGFARSTVGKPLTRDAGMFKMRGIAGSGVPGGYSWRKHELTDCGQKSHPSE